MGTPMVQKGLPNLCTKLKSYIEASSEAFSEAAETFSHPAADLDPLIERYFYLCGSASTKFCGSL